MKVYLYSYQGQDRVYSLLAKAVEQMLKDVGFSTLKEYVNDCSQWGVSVTWDNEQLSVDDGGPEIKKVEYIS